ncbi:hypothetical protein [Pontibacter rugosus]|uniref:DUF922 domain-containing protein n=1 Tax=Pontibacter rugosus TaxID=1745966 RepID=A0ABW3SRE0_9BACT
MIKYKSIRYVPIVGSYAVVRFVSKLALWVALILAATILLSATFAVPDNTPLVLKSESLPFTPKEFFIADVVDERADRKTVAHLIPHPAAGSAPSTTAQPVDLQGGGLNSLKQFISKGLHQDTKLRPITIRLKEMSIREMPAEQGRVEGKAVVAMEFELEREGEQVKLTAYKGGVRYIRSAKQGDVAEPALRQSLVEALKYLNTWMNKEAATNEKLASATKVNFVDYVAAIAHDTVFYAAERPLKWADFTGRPSKPSSFAASIFPSFSYEGQSEVINGVVHINLLVKTYMLPSSSWVKAGHLDAYALNHEQKHFDIVKLIAERFKKKITPEILSVADYNSIIQYHYIESFREMNQLQEQYDAETRHGLNQVAQEEWNRRIASELAAY